MWKFWERRTARALGRWQETIITKQRTGGEEKDDIPHPAAAPVSTDQEAGGASTTPGGRRRYEYSRDKVKEES